MPAALTRTSAVAAGSRTVLPFNVASAFHGAPNRIQRRFATKRALSPGCSVRSKTCGPVAVPLRTASQQGPREATTTIRARREVCGAVGADARGEGTCVVVGGA